MTEIWKQVPSFPALEVSSIGRIRVIPYTVKIHNNANRTYGGAPSLGAWTDNGRGQRRYVYNFRGRKLNVARLVCETFNGRSPFKGAIVMHDDEDSRNNKPTNLKWGTHKENLNYPGYLAKLRRPAAMRARR